MTTRSMVLWCPDWPVRAATRAAGVPAAAPVALLQHGQVLACSTAARAEGVRRGQRARDAQSRCPELVLLGYDEALDVRAFDPLLRSVEEISPGVRLLRPGTCSLLARGPSRYFGGEVAAAAVVAQRAVELGVDDCRLGVADGTFAAEQAARRAPVQESHVVEPGGSARFLADLPVDALADPTLTDLLHRLGVRTLGAFAALPARDVMSRFGDRGVLAHRLARGTDTRPVAVRRPPPELVAEITFETPLERVDQVAFSTRRTAEDFVSSLARHGLVCTTVWVEVHGQEGETSERQWMHPRWFDAVDLLDRLRWQLQGAVGTSGGGAGAESGLASPVVSVRLVPDEVAALAEHADGLWGSGPDEQVGRAMARVQSMLGHGGVGSVVLAGGRSPAERQTYVAWGDQPVPERSPALPWPGSLPPPAPATVYAEPRPAVVTGGGGRSVGVTGRGVLSEEPQTFSVDGGPTGPVQAWAGPWPVDERWWDPEQARRVARLQVVGVDGSAWLLCVEDGRWWTEARYD